MIDNFEQFKNCIANFEDPEDFYFVQILKRRKDNPDMTKNMAVVHEVNLYNKEDFEKKKDMIVRICNRENARAYIRVNKRNSFDVALKVLRKATDYILSTDYKAVKKAYSSVCGETCSEKIKKWIVDIDFFPMEENSGSLNNKILVVTDFINRLQPVGDKLITVLPTKNGCHLITYPFRLDTFTKEFPTIDVHKDQPTILYIPSILDIVC